MTSRRCRTYFRSTRSVSRNSRTALHCVIRLKATKDEIFEAVDRFYRSYYLRPKPILRIIKTMLEDKDVFVRRCREGYEFFKSMRQRNEDSDTAKQVVATM